MHKAKFCLYMFAPISLAYLLPLIFYKLPIKVRTALGVYEIQPITLISTIIACVIWFGIAILLITYPNLIQKRKTAERVWNKEARWAAFWCFSLIGSFIAIVHRVLLLPVAIEQLVHQLSLMPAIGFILGLCCIQDLKSKKDNIVKETLVFIFMGLDILVVFVLPIIFGYVQPVAISSVAILFGMSIIGVRPVRQLAVLGIFIIFIFGAMNIKDYLRIQMCGGACEPVAIQQLFGTEDSIELAKKEDLPQKNESRKTPKFLKSLESPKVELAKKEDKIESRIIKNRGKEELLESLYYQKRVFVGGYDPNFKGIRFLPQQLENSFLHYFVARVLHRINRLGDLAYVIQTTGKDILYTYGRTYVPLLTKPIPRLFWPEKPIENFPQYYGHRYKFIADEDLSTAIVLPLIAEGYMNWGWFGIVFSATLVGGVLRILWELWIGNKRATGNVILGMVVVLTMLAQEKNLSILLGGLLYGGVVWWIIEVLFRKWFSEKKLLGHTNLSFQKKGS